jgi:predicted phage terminase large subunit-like protein
MLFRRTYADLALPGAIMERAAEWLGPTPARWNGTEKRWTFPSGATLGFGYLDKANDHYRYQGMQAQFIGIDELTQLEDRPALYLFSRLRRLKGSQVPIRYRCGTNPGGIGHGWVKDRYIPDNFEAMPREERFSKPWMKGERLFVPARLQDNLALDRDEYRESLKELDPFTRAQLEEGDWTEYSGGLFRREWFEIVGEAPAEMQRVRAWDLAGGEKEPGKDPDWTAGVRMGRHRNGVCYVEDVKRVRASSLSVENLIRQTAELDGPSVRVSVEREPGSAGKALIERYHREVLAGFIFDAEEPSGDKTTRARGLASAAEAGNVKLVRGPWCRDFLEELAVFPYGAFDDQVDGAAYAHNRLTLPKKWKKLGVVIG